MRDPTKQLTKGELHRAWRLVTWAGVLGSTYYTICVNGIPRVKFLTELDATAADFGLISGLASFAIVFQIAGGVIGNRIRHRKSLWMAMVIAHRLLFLGVLVVPMVVMDPSFRMFWIILVLFFHDMLAQTSGPMFMSWMADLLPRESLNRHWATRQRFITIANMFVMAAIGFGFNYFETRGLILEGFSIIAGVGVVLGVTDILLFTGVPEPDHARVENIRLRDVLLQPLRDKAFRPFLFYRAYWTLAVSVAAPFFGLYMIDELGLRVLTVQLMGIASALGVTLTSRFWGLVCDTYGFRPSLQFLTLGKIVPPLAFFVVPHEPWIAVPFLTLFMFYDGALNAGMMLATQGVLLKSTPRHNRGMYIAASSFLSVGIMATLGAIFSGHLVDFLAPRMHYSRGIFTLTGFHAAFALSAFIRFGAFYMVSRMEEPGGLSMGEVIRQLWTRGTLRTVRLVYRLSESRTPAQRMAAAEQLAAIRHPLAMGELISALRDEEKDVRKAAANALGEIGVSEAVEPLSRALFDPASGIQRRAARALGRIGGMDSLKALLENLRHRDSKALGETIDALARLNHDAAYLPLIGLFHDVEDEKLRLHIAAALGRMSQTEELSEVLDLLNARRPPGPSPIR